MNLLQETERSMIDASLSPEEIIFIGSRNSGHQCTWIEFCELADKEYNSGYSSQEVAADLIIVFSGGEIMYREECDGNEWWEWRRPFVLPPHSHPITGLFGKFSYSLEAINQTTLPKNKNK